MKARTCSSFQISKSFIILLIKVGSRTRTATLLSFLKTEIWYDSLKILLLLLILPIWPFHPVTSVHFTSVFCISFSSVVHSFLFCFAVFKNICHLQFVVCFFPLVCATSWTLSSLTVWSSLRCSCFSGQVTLQNQRKGKILAPEGSRGSHFLWSHSKRCLSQWVLTSFSFWMPSAFGSPSKRTNKRRQVRLEYTTFKQYVLDQQFPSLPLNV